MVKLLVGFVVLLLIFVPLERLFTLRKEQRIFRKGWLNDLIHFSVNNFLVQLGLIFLAILFLPFLRRLVNADFQASVAAQPQWLQFVEAVLIAEVSFYFIHRLSHTVPWLWKFHAVHHSIEEMDWLASARLHPVDLIIGKGFVVVPLYLMGFTASTFGFYLVISAFQAIFVHSNVRINFGPLRWLINTPELHHWHHSDDRGTHNKNFCGLPLVDWLFGTLYLPTGQMPRKYGIQELIPQHYLKQLTYPFHRSKDRLIEPNLKF